MSTTYRRFDALKAVRKAEENLLARNGSNKLDMNISEIFGENCLSIDTLKERLPKSVWKVLKKTIRDNEPLDETVADAVAVVMKEWASEKGATHYTHWFQPLTGATAEKHDSFITPNQGGGAITQFSGNDLMRGEPDASSFPSGGLRPTFEARGYTAWDPTSPAFIIENGNGSTLCIPSVFASWKGESLDFKAPLLRSTEALNKQALRALKLFGIEDVNWVNSTGGFEQEYFLIDQEFFYRRPDLMTSGRTLFGAKPPKGQELDDHYFGSIPDRILSFMLEAERELYRLGVPVKTRHNEVAPGQFEIAPVFEKANVAADHQQLTMIILKKVAKKYGLECLLHEKPFAGLNGSGKHLNWSMSTSKGGNLLEPGDSPHDNMQFLFFFAATLKAVYDHQGLLRASIASAGNDHRLGANEAPPAILSAYVGDQLEDIVEQIKNGGATSSKEGGLLGLGIPVLPDIPKHAGDRNRTSPFAFTGNKFEFRAVGSEQTVSFPASILNVTVAEAIDGMTTLLEEEIAKTGDFEKALGAVLKETFEEIDAILFHGDGYSEEWQVEAKKRGLLNLKSTLDAMPYLTAESTVSLFEKYNVLAEHELESRLEIYLEQYFIKLNIEAETTEDVVRTMVIPATIRYLNEILAAGDLGKSSGLDVSTTNTLAKQVNDLLAQLIAQVDKLGAANADLGGDTIPEKAAHLANVVLPEMNKTREIADKLEKVVADDYWPLPSYREMLFVK
ncbi:glutamine synthetase III [Balneolales bacterium ANBcel1]|nr:glutamine synthetase III [Balneolales bacterium ANBcel1]